MRNIQPIDKNRAKAKRPRMYLQIVDFKQTQQTKTNKKDDACNGKTGAGEVENIYTE